MDIGHMGHKQGSEWGLGAMEGSGVAESTQGRGKARHKAHLFRKCPYAN